IAGRLSQQYGLDIVIAGSPDEMALADELAGLMPAKAANLAGRTNIPELVEVLRGARFIVGNDTGPTHIAAALGVSVVIIFGLINPARLYPYGKRECVAAVDPWTRPEGIRTDNMQYRVENVTIEMVWEKVVEQMKDVSGPKR
ncbi:MAG TPA: glycosyltransferase family 9 protein, partial [Sedimentisphaerales bacterium]|nr:glycosyltransferase family 9 protein [Sedimentisphaerales bacterium]